VLSVEGRLQPHLLDPHSPTTLLKLPGRESKNVQKCYSNRKALILLDVGKTYKIMSLCYSIFRLKNNLDFYFLPFISYLPFISFYHL
jgi:hypothetical protein